MKRAEDRKRQEEAEDARRAAEWAARSEKIARSMQFMANTVGKQQEEIERVNAEKLRKHLEDKRLRDDEDERQRKLRMEQRLKEMKEGLSSQIQEKERLHKLEVEQTQAYMRRVLEQAEQAKREQQKKEKKR